MDYFTIEMTLISLGYISFSTVLQRKLIDTRRVAELQHLISVKTKELTELHKNNASPELKKAKQDELQAHSMESAKHMFKPLIVAFPLFLLFYYVIFPAVFGLALNVYVFSFTLNYRIYFVYASLIFGILIQSTLQRRDKAKMLKEKAAQASQMQNQASQQ